MADFEDKGVKIQLAVAMDFLNPNAIPNQDPQESSVNLLKPWQKFGDNIFRFPKKRTQDNTLTDISVIYSPNTRD